MIPASIRNNNPGSQEPGFASKRWGSTTHETLKWVDANGKSHTNLIATFPTHQHGGAALFALLSEGKYYRNKPIQEVIATWCGGNSASEYIDHMEKATGLKRTALLTAERIRDPDIAVPIARAIARFEAGAGVDLPLSEDDWRSIHKMAFGTSSAPAPTVDNDVPFQKPEGVARELIGRIKRWFAGVFGTIGSVGVVGAVSGETSYIPSPPAAMKQTFVNLGSWADVIPTAQWKMLLVGASVFTAVSVGSWAIGRLRNG